jgi:hypothetical protein
MAEFFTPTKGETPSSRASQLHAHLIAGSKGGTGKTTILFHAAAQYAFDHPSESVLVIDCSFAGDLSERLLGGAAMTAEGMTAGEKAMEALHTQGKSTAHLFAYLAETVARRSPLVPPRSASVTPDTVARGSFMDAWRRLSVSAHKPEVPPTPGPPPAKNIADAYGVLVHRHNPHIALDNLFLIPNGSGRQPAFGLDLISPSYRRMAHSLREHLLALPGTWRCFFDTDGDLELSGSTEVVVRAVDTCAMFTETDSSDFRRVCIFLNDLQAIRRACQLDGSMCASVAVVVFNKVEASTQQDVRFEDLGCAVRPHIVSVRQMVLDFAGRLANVVLCSASAAGQLGLFSNAPGAAAAPGTSEEGRRAGLLRSSFMVMQHYRNAGFLGNAAGVPLCCMAADAVYAGHPELTEYLRGGKVADHLGRLKANVKELTDRL